MRTLLDMIPPPKAGEVLSKNGEVFLLAVALVIVAVVLCTVFALRKREDR